MRPREWCVGISATSLRLPGIGFRVRIDGPGVQMGLLTGERIRSSKSTAHQYERDLPGDLMHMYVKEIGKIPDGGGWRAHGRAAGRTNQQKKRASDTTTSIP